MEVAANTTPQEIAIQCMMPRLRLTTLPASWRVGSTAKTVGAITKAKKIRPPIQITSDNNIRNRTRDMRTSQETGHCKWRLVGSGRRSNDAGGPRRAPFFAVTLSERLFLPAPADISVVILSDERSEESKEPLS